MQQWNTEHDRIVFDAHIFKIHQVQRVHPTLGRGTFVVLDSPDWVHIIPVTSAGNIVLIRQYRHGINDFSLEIPSGLIEQGELPVEAARRECIEETGYEGEGMPQLLGICEPNPAFLNNRCYIFIWYNCQRRYPQRLDQHEEIEVLEVSKNRISELVCNGQIRHSLMITAFAFWLFQCEQKKNRDTDE